MLIHDQYSGYMQEVPDHLAGNALGEVVYDGFGNAVGWNPFDTIRQAVSGVGNLVRGAVQGAGNAVGQAAQMPFNMLGRGVNMLGQGVNAAGQAIQGLFPGMPGQPSPQPGAPYPFPTQGGPMFPQAPYRPPMMGGYPRPWPLGWMRSPLPYTGLGPKRLYMRCAVWPGPQGLVPSFAANMPPGMQPGMPGFPGMPGQGGAGRRRRRRR